MTNALQILVPRPILSVLDSTDVLSFIPEPDQTQLPFSRIRNRPNTSPSRSTSALARRERAILYLIGAHVEQFLLRPNIPPALAPVDETIASIASAITNGNQDNPKCVSGIGTMVGTNKQRYHVLTFSRDNSYCYVTAYFPDPKEPWSNIELCILADSSSPFHKFLVNAGPGTAIGRAIHDPSQRLMWALELIVTHAQTGTTGLPVTYRACPEHVTNGTSQAKALNLAQVSPVLVPVFESESRRAHSEGNALACSATLFSLPIPPRSFSKPHSSSDRLPTDPNTPTSSSKTGRLPHEQRFSVCRFRLGTLIRADLTSAVPTGDGTKVITLPLCESRDKFEKGILDAISSLLCAGTVLRATPRSKLVQSIIRSGLLDDARLLALSHYHNLPRDPDEPSLYARQISPRQSSGIAKATAESIVRQSQNPQDHEDKSAAPLTL